MPKILRLNKKLKKFIKIKNFGEMRPLSEESLQAQILKIFEANKILKKVGVSLVFSKQEEKRILAPLRQLVGGFRLEQGLGHGMSGEDLLFSDILKRIGLYRNYLIPVDRNAKQLLTEVESWELAVKSWDLDWL